MRKWVTEFQAICAKTGMLETYCGDNIAAPSLELAQEWCHQNAGHLQVVGELVSEIPCKKGTYKPDWKNQIDYDTPQLN